MSIVTENNVHDALAYLAEDPHPLAIARHATTMTENKAKEAFARAILKARGTDAAKRAEATIDPAYLDAKKEEEAAILNFERHKARVNAASMLIEVWRTENANARASERVR